MNNNEKIKQLEEKIEFLESQHKSPPGMYNFAKKKCEVCGDRIGSGEGAFNFFIIERENPPEDSLCFCGLHEPIFLDEVLVDWMDRIKSNLRIQEKNGRSR